MKKPATEIEKLDTELAHEQSIKKSLQESLAADIAAQAEAEKSRDEIAYTALTEPTNEDARKQLDEREAILAKTAQRIVSHQKAISVSTERIVQLREHKAEAVRHEQQAKYESGQADLMTAAADFELKLAAFIEQKETIEKKFTELNRLSFGLYEDDTRPHKNLPRAFRWALEQRLALDTPYRDHGFRERFKKPIHEIFNRIMSSAEGAIEQPENGEIKTVVVTKGELENELHS